MADERSKIDWERLKSLGSIDQLRSSYIVVVLVPPVVQLLQMAERTLEQVEAVSISIDVGWRLPVAYFAAFALAVGKLIFDIKAPASIREFASAQHLLLHGRQVHPEVDPEDHFVDAFAEGRMVRGPVIIVPRESDAHVDILGPSRQGEIKYGDSTRPIEITSDLAFGQWASDRCTYLRWRVATAVAFGVGAVLSAMLVAHSLWSVAAALL